MSQTLSQMGADAALQQLLQQFPTLRQIQQTVYTASEEATTVFDCYDDPEVAAETLKDKLATMGLDLHTAAVELNQVMERLQAVENWLRAIKDHPEGAL